MVPRPEPGALYYRPQSQAAAQKIRVAGSHPTLGTPVQPQKLLDKSPIAY